MQQQIGYHNPNIQISNLEVPVGMVDGILTKLRNPVNQDLWLTDRFSTSVNHHLFLSLVYSLEARPEFGERALPILQYVLKQASTPVAIGGTQLQKHDNSPTFMWQRPIKF